jgi:hypothetical protein
LEHCLEVARAGLVFQVVEFAGSDKRDRRRIQRLQLAGRCLRQHQAGCEDGFGALDRGDALGAGRGPLDEDATV